MKFPFIIFFRYDKYKDIDNFFNINTELLNFSVYITNNYKKIEKLHNPNYQLLITYGEDFLEYKDDVLKIISEKMLIRHFHVKQINNLTSFNQIVNDKFITNCSLHRDLLRPTFSLFTPAYNSYHKIMRVYESLKAQTLKDWEWIIMDDSPDDKHFDFLKKNMLNDSRIRLYRHSHNNGSIGNVKNEIVSLCRGNYVLEMDHDDEILPFVLKESADLFVSKPEVGFIYMDFIGVYESGENQYYGEPLSKGYGGYYSMKYNDKWRLVYITPNINNITMSHLACCPNHPRIWRKNVLLQMGNYCEHLHICDDYEILLRTAVHCKIAKIHKMGYIQYMNNDNNNFSLIRHKEINRLVPDHISPIYYNLYKINDKMKQFGAYEDEKYMKNYSNIWLRESSYVHNYCNLLINNDYDNQICIIGIESLMYYLEIIKKLYKNQRNDFLLLDSRRSNEYLWKLLEKLELDRMKCYTLKEHTNIQLIKYFEFMYVSTDNYEIYNINITETDNLFKNIYNYTDGLILTTDNSNNNTTDTKTDTNTYKSIKKIYIVSNLEGGGSIKYLDDIVNHYKNVEIIKIKSKDMLFSITNYSPYDILFVQQLLWSDISPKDLIEIKNKFNITIVISIHDFCWFIEDDNVNNPNKNIWEIGYLLKLKNINPDIITLFSNADLVIHPSKFTLMHYNKCFPTCNTIIQEHNDIQFDYSAKYVPKIVNDVINIGNFQTLSLCKGSENVMLLKNSYTHYKGHKINFLIVGQNISGYDETNWNTEILNHNFHCLLHLNKYGETYSYCLTKSINSGLPILYNNIGSFKVRIPNNKDHYKKVIDNEDEYENQELLFKKFEEMLDYIIINNGLFNKSNYNNKIVYNSLFNYLFETNNNNDDFNKIHKKIHNKIKPFAVYFPQFHNIAENNLNYYNGMTDITNLNHYNNNNNSNKLDSPLLSEFGLKNMLEYDLTNKNIINKQIEIAKKHCIYGFAVYYYWFSTNTITNKNTIMEKCYDLFFEKEINDFKIFFIWANEDWTGNPAFNTEHQILNIYDEENYKKNIKNLMKYFKHSNYHKVDNKPIFYIHHPFLIPEEKIEMFRNVLNTECIENGFDGAILVLNSLIKKYENQYNYNFHPNYKKATTLDYDLYVERYVKPENDPNTIFFDFDNSARLCIPDKLKLRSKYTNNSILNQSKYLEKVLNQYKTREYDNKNLSDENNENEINKIMLINSWNEWGENMAIEPGEINGYKYLSLLKSKLFSFIC